MTDKSKKAPPLLATDSTPRPGDYPVGSPESRAAARALLHARDELRNRIRENLTVIVTAVGGTAEPPRCERKLPENGLLTEFVYWPDPTWSNEQLRSFVERHTIGRDRRGDGA